MTLMLDKRARHCLFLALLAALLLPTSCKKEQETPQPTQTPSTREYEPVLRTVQMQIGNRLFTLEVAENDDDRARGLMHREWMPADHGMIFVFDREQRMGFWMKNTLIPLDILYVSETGRVVTIAQMKPLDLNPAPSRAPAKYAIELNAGTAKEVGVEVGDVIKIPEAARDPRE